MGAAESRGAGGEGRAGPGRGGPGRGGPGHGGPGRAGSPVFAAEADCHDCGRPCEALDGIGIDREEPLEGTVKPYGKHIGICTGERTWPEKVEKAQGYVKALRAALDRHASRLPYEIMVTALDEPTKPWTGDWPVASAAAPWPGDECMDLLVFPDMLRIRLVAVEQLPAFARFIVDHHVASASDTPLADGHAFMREVPVEPIVGAYVLVCVHRARDKRCGTAGPLLLDAFDDARQALGIADRVHLTGTSHVGGHKFAGVAIIYPTADWFGRLVPTDAETILRELCSKGRVVRANWRGRPPVVRSTHAAHALTVADPAEPAEPTSDPPPATSDPVGLDPPA